MGYVTSVSGEGGVGSVTLVSGEGGVGLSE